MKKTGFLVIGLLLPLAMNAQQKDEDDFSNFLKEQSAEFERFVDEANKDFISFMRNPWKEFKAEKPVEKRVKPEPVKPVVYDEKTAPKDKKPVRINIEEILDLTTAEGKQKPVTKVKDVDDITFDQPAVIVKKKKEPVVIVVEEKVVGKEPVKEKPKRNPVTVEPEKKPVVVEPVEEKPVVKPETPVVKPETPAVKPEVPVATPETPVVTPEVPVEKSTPLFAGGTGRTKFVYGGMTYYLSNALNRKCRLASLSENAIADAYEALCASDYKPLLKDLGTIKNDILFNDWALFMFVKQVAEEYCGTYNESVVMRQFILNEMGYKARMARKANENKMVLYVATDCQIYGSIFITQGGQKYYDLDNKQPYQFYMCQKDSPKARNSVSMYWKTTPVLKGEKATSTHQAAGSAARTTVSVPKALIDYYKTYPQCDYSVYVKARVDAEVESTILSSLVPVVANKSKQEAANILLNFVQTAFRYATDDEQFGYEKPFFVEELFYYPCCDCEDRSVLFAYLVKSLLKLDVVYLDYPNHIATAVRFDEEVGGDYLMVGGQKYTVCDPTYIGAGIGMTMPQFKTVAANVLKY